MLNRQELKSYRDLRGLSLHDVEKYCNLSRTMISMFEKGERNLTEESYRELVKGINKAYQAKKDGTLHAPEPLKKVVRKKKTPSKKNAEE